MDGLLALHRLELDAVLCYEVPLDALAALGGWSLLVGTNPEFDGAYNDEDLALYGSWGEDRERRARDEALRRLYKEPEDFGKCIECGNEISMERLELIPWTTLCRDHQAESEGGS